MLLHVGDLLDVLLDSFDPFVIHQEVLRREGDAVALLLHLKEIERERETVMIKQRKEDSITKNYWEM